MLLWSELFKKLNILVETNCLIKQLIENEYLNDSFIQKMLSLLWNDTQKSKKIMLSECQIQFNWLYYQNCLVVLNHDKLKLKLLHYVHKTLISDHSDHIKILDLLICQYYWSQMYETVWKFVVSCHVYQWSKISRKTYNELLKLLSVLD